MCGAEMSAPLDGADDAMSASKKHAVAEERADMNLSEVVESFATNDSDSRPDDSRRGRFGAKIGAAVRSVRQNSMEDDKQESRGLSTGMSSRFNFKKRRPGTSSEPLFDDSAITLKRVHASGLAPSVGPSSIPKIPLKLLEGNWIVSVKSQQTMTVLSSNSLSAMEGRDDPKFVAYEVSAGGDGRYPSETAPKPDVAKIAVESKGHFDVRTQRRDNVESQAAVQAACSFGALVELHAAVSECVGQILPQLSSEHFGKQDQNGGVGPLEDDSYNLIENVLMTGRILGGFFGDDIRQQNLEKTREYQGKKRITCKNYFIHSQLTLGTFQPRSLNGS